MEFNDTLSEFEKDNKKILDNLKNAGDIELSKEMLLNSEKNITGFTIYIVDENYRFLKKFLNYGTDFDNFNLEEIENNFNKSYSEELFPLVKKSTVEKIIDFTKQEYTDCVANGEKFEKEKLKNIYENFGNYIYDEDLADNITQDSNINFYLKNFVDNSNFFKENAEKIDMFDDKELDAFTKHFSSKFYDQMNDLQNAKDPYYNNKIPFSEINNIQDMKIVNEYIFPKDCTLSMSEKEMNFTKNLISNTALNIYYDKKGNFINSSDEFKESIQESLKFHIKENPELKKSLAEIFIKEYGNPDNLFMNKTIKNENVQEAHVQETQRQPSFKNEIKSEQTSLPSPLSEHENELAKKAGYVQGVCECVAAIFGDSDMGKKLLYEMNVTRDMAKKYANPETFKTLEQSIFAPKPEQKLEQQQSIGGMKR